MNRNHLIAPILIHPRFGYIPRWTVHPAFRLLHSFVGIGMLLGFAMLFPNLRRFVPVELEIVGIVLINLAALWGILFYGYWPYSTIATSAR